MAQESEQDLLNSPLTHRLSGGYLSSSISALQESKGETGKSSAFENVLTNRPPQNRRARSESSPSSINLNTSVDHVALQVAHPLAQYHEKSLENVMICLIITSIAVGSLSYLHMHVGWSFVALAISMFSIRRRNIGIKDDFLSHVTRKRLEALQHPGTSGESAEWINGILKTIWPILNPDLFQSLLALLEKTMKHHSPGIITGIRLQDLVLGTNNIQVLSFKVLPENTEIGGHTQATEEGDFIALEVEFSYRRLPPPHPKGGNTHFMAYFKVGGTIEVPVVVEVRGITGRLRLRIQLISDPPFVRHVYLHFPEVPDLQVVANPLRSTIDLMNVPILSQFVDNALAEVFSLFTAPKFYAVDCSRILLGSDVEIAPQSTGVIVVIIHSATEVSRHDAGFVSVGFARFGKPLYSTRTIRQDNGDPHFEETFFLRLVPEDADEGDSIRLTLWDSVDDGNLVDDAVGTVDVKLAEMFKEPNSIDRHTCSLQAVNRKPQPRGSLTFSIGFFTLAHRDTNKDIKKSNSSGDIPSFVHKGRTDTVSRASLYSDRIKGALESLMPPDPELVSGICTIQLHSMENLEIPEKRGVVSSKKREKLPPNSYCQLFVNDEKIYQTRVKSLSNAPYINASCEFFCRDWTHTAVTVVALDWREKEEDVVIGIYASTLQSFLGQRTQKTSWQSLVGGAGYGRIRMSALFKSLAINIPKPLRTWSLGVLVVSRIQAHGIPVDAAVQVHVKSDNWTSKTSYSQATTSIDRKGVKHTNCIWTLEPFLHIPIVKRHRGVAILQIRTKDDLWGEAVVWLNTVPDREIVTLHDVPIYNSEFERLQQNNWTAPIVTRAPSKGTGHSHFHSKDKHKGKSVDARTTVTWSDLPPSVGTMELELHVEPGLSFLHRQITGDFNSDLDEAVRAWEYKTKVANIDPAAEEIPLPRSRDSKSPRASAPNSRRSSWGGGELSSSDEAVALKNMATNQSVSSSSQVGSSKSKLKKPMKWVSKGLGLTSSKSVKTDGAVLPDSRASTSTIATHEDSAKAD